MDYQIAIKQIEVRLRSVEDWLKRSGRRNNAARNFAECHDCGSGSEEIFIDCNKTGRWRAVCSVCDFEVLAPSESTNPQGAHAEWQALDSGPDVAESEPCQTTQKRP